MTKSTVSSSAAFLLLFVAPPLGAQDAAPDARPAGAIAQFLETTRPLEISVNETPLQKLLKQRFNVALNEFRERHAGHQSGTSTPREVFDASIRLKEAEIALARTPAERIAVLQRHLPAIREFETDFEALVQAGLRRPAELNQLRFVRLTIEIEIEQAKLGR